MAALARPHSTSGLDAVYAEIAKRHDEAVKRLQTWIRQPSIAAENRGQEGCESPNPKVQGLDGAVHSHVDFIYAIAEAP